MSDNPLRSTIDHKVPALQSHELAERNREIHAPPEILHSPNVSFSTVHFPGGWQLRRIKPGTKDPNGGGSSLSGS
jgi:hypothetical protein